MQLYRYFVSHYYCCCFFRYRRSAETFGYTFVLWLSAELVNVIDIQSYRADYFNLYIRIGLLILDRCLETAVSYGVCSLPGNATGLQKRDHGKPNFG